jgi:transcriptional regulator with XRE-family HTH domain
MRLTDHRKKSRQNPEFIAAEKELKPFLVLADNVLRHRLEKGWSQSELAKRVGTKQSNISRLEDGISNPTLKFIAKLSDALDVNIAELMKERDSTSQDKESGTHIEIINTFEIYQNEPQPFLGWYIDITNPAPSSVERVLT